MLKQISYPSTNQIKTLGESCKEFSAARLVRIVLAATNRDLRSRIAEGHFREDLFYRLNVIEVKLPPLRARGEDVLLMAEYFLARFARQSSKPVKSFNEEAAAMLLQYTFPGNVRELENPVQRAVMLTEGDLIQKMQQHGLKWEDFLARKS